MPPGLWHIFYCWIRGDSFQVYKWGLQLQSWNYVQCFMSITLHWVNVKLRCVAHRQIKVSLTRIAAFPNWVIFSWFYIWTVPKVNGNSNVIRFCHFPPTLRKNPTKLCSGSESRACCYFPSPLYWYNVISGVQLGCAQIACISPSMQNSHWLLENWVSCPVNDLIEGKTKVHSVSECTYYCLKPVLCYSINSTWNYAFGKPYIIPRLQL